VEVAAGFVFEDQRPVRGLHQLGELLHDDLEHLADLERRGQGLGDLVDRGQLFDRPAGRA